MNKTQGVPVCGLVLLALYAAGAAAQVRFIDGVNARALGGVQARASDGLDAPAADDLQTRREAIRKRIANGTLGSKKGAKHRKHGRPGDPALLALPHWTGSFRSEGVDYPFTVIGGDPTARQTTVVPTVVVPYRFVFADGGVVDASSDVIDGTTQVEGMLASPLFNDFPFAAGATPLGTTQFGDAYMRGNFWSRHGGAGSGYHMRLQVTRVVSPALEINVPAELGFSIPLGNGETLGVIDELTLDGIVQSVMVSLGIRPSTLTIHAVAQLLTVGGGFESFGYHRWADLRAQTQADGIHTYIVSAWFSKTAAPFSANAEVLGHEITEWLMDPLIANVVPTWNDPGAPSLCWNPTLEVADPLELFPGQTVALNGRDWLLPDVVFLPWFERVPSRSVNGWFSMLNNLTRFTDKCPFAEYVGVTIYPNDPGVSQTQFTSVNNRKQGTGFSVQSGLTVGFALDNLDPASPDPVVRTPISVPGSLVTLPVKINDSGQIVGLYVDALGDEHGFLLSSGRYATIDFPGAVATEVLALNNKHNLTVAGVFTDTAGAGHGFTYEVDGGGFKRFDVPGAVDTAIWGINNSNKITGRFVQADGHLRGFTGTLGKAQPIDYINNPLNTTAPGGINNAGVIAGSVAGDGFGGGFLAAEGDFVPGNMDLSNDVNDQGWVAGGFVFSGSLVGAIGTPLDPHSFGPSGRAGSIQPGAQQVTRQP